MSSHKERFDRLTCSVAVFAAPALAAPLFAGVVQVTYDTPTLDRWMYPFNPTSGERASSSTFGTFGEVDFDNRDAQMIVGFATAGDVPPGLGAASYHVISARLTLQNDGDEGFIYDDTQDPYVAFLDPADPDYVADADPGQPVELYGLGFRYGLNRFSWQENTPYNFGGPLGRGIRTAYAIDYDQNGDPVDVSLNVEDRFDPTPWAIGVIDGVTPGDFVPLQSDMVFDVNVADENVQRHFQESLNDGILDLAVTSLTIVAVQEGDFPSFYNKENLLVQLGEANAARLELEVEIVDACPEDLDGSGAVDFGDILAILSTWGPCDGCPEDLSGNQMVDFEDILIILGSWGPCL